MRNRVIKTQNMGLHRFFCAANISSAMSYILAVTLSVMCIVVAFYADDGYNQIGNAKFAVYRVTMLIGFSLFLVLRAVYLLLFLWEKPDQKRRLSITDGCVLAYLLFTTISVVSGGFYEDALWGSFGWNMGWMSQLSFVLIYLALSRFGKYYHAILAAFCGSAFVVFVIAILHRMLIDPIGFYEGLQGYQMAQFLSTMGQATWYASYLIVALPVGVAVFLFAEKTLWWFLGGVYTAVGFASLVTQNSDSAYFAMTGFMLVFFWVCVERRETLNRFVEVCTLFFAAGKVMHFLMKVHPNPDLEYDFITALVLDGMVTWVLLGVCLLLSLFLYGRRNRSYSVEVMLRVRQMVVLFVVAALVIIAGLIVLQSSGLLPGGIGETLSAISYFNWGSEWGNGRGRIWSFAIRVFAGESIGHKLFGIGPDCLSSYTAAVHREEVSLLWGEKLLTNAHNEWLNTLINTGIFGATVYIGIFVSAVGRFLRVRQDYLLVGASASAVSYMAYNFFCYQQVCCTPFVFL
ncbi:MAG: O-antigen ligase family protein, partial [Lachnospiraceae bacterium]|nr:O-antigen ligase family protein [Lachnospiraceae bacterium]